MKLIGRLVCGALSFAAVTMLGGCDSITQVKEENQQLREIILKQEKANQQLQAQIEALRAKPEGVDPVELRRLELELQKREKQLAVYRRGLHQMRGRVALSERIEVKLQALADELGGEMVGNKLMLPCDYFFASGRYDLMPEGKKKLQKFAEVLKDENLMLMIVGHTDNVPIKNLKKRNITTNRQLSLMRATAVLEALNTAGYPKNLMYPTGWGELKPFVPNTSAKNRQLNRRVEIYVDPAGSGLMNASAITDVSPVVTEEVISTPATTVEIVNDGGPVVVE